MRAGVVWRCAGGAGELTWRNLRKFPGLFGENLHVFSRTLVEISVDFTESSPECSSSTRSSALRSVSLPPSQSYPWSTLSSSSVRVVRMVPVHPAVIPQNHVQVQSLSPEAYLSINYLVPRTPSPGHTRSLTHHVAHYPSDICSMSFVTHL